MQGHLPTHGTEAKHGPAPCQLCGVPMDRQVESCERSLQLHLTIFSVADSQTDRKQARLTAQEFHPALRIHLTGGQRREQSR